MIYRITVVICICLILSACSKYTVPNNSGKLDSNTTTITSQKLNETAISTNTPTPSRRNDLTPSDFEFLRLDMEFDEVVKHVGLPHHIVGDKFSYIYFLKDGSIVELAFRRKGKLSTAIIDLNEPKVTKNLLK